MNDEELVPILGQSAHVLQQLIKYLRLSPQSNLHDIELAIGAASNVPASMSPLAQPRGPTSVTPTMKRMI